MKKVTITLFTFIELSAQAQQAAISANKLINVNGAWWSQIEQEAKNLGVHFSEFDIDDESTPTVKGSFKSSDIEVATKIMEKYEPGSSLYSLAKNFIFIDEQARLIESLERKNLTESGIKLIKSDIKTSSQFFLGYILTHLGNRLKNYYNEITSDEAVTKTLMEKNILFEEDGRKWRRQVKETEQESEKTKHVLKEIFDLLENHQPVFYLRSHYEKIKNAIQ